MLLVEGVMADESGESMELVLNCCVEYLLLLRKQNPITTPTTKTVKYKSCITNL